MVAKENREPKGTSNYFIYHKGHLPEKNHLNEKIERWF
jgi:hypothetical protein